MSGAAKMRAYRRWSRLSVLVTDLERAFEAACRLDQCEHAEREARQTSGRGRQAFVADQLAERFERRLVWLETVLDQELDRLTAERLRFDLDEKVKNKTAAA